MKKSKLTIAAGVSASLIAVVHTVVFTFHPYWSDWLSGGLRDGEADFESVAVFWALPGGFVVPLFLLGLLLVRMGRRGEPVPFYVPAGLAAWVAFCVYLLGPSGFLLALVPLTLLVLARVRTPRPADERVSA
ncbi:DUF6463 family protein [Salininema proteolyticum]|uniref:DUF6463 family protein n=1 Tax=Salininema proteolyticum TaxID=1607685 RepID=A0ABV8TXD7_9ACTN